MSGLVQGFLTFLTLRPNLFIKLHELPIKVLIKVIIDLKISLVCIIFALQLNLQLLTV